MVGPRLSTPDSAPACVRDLEASRLEDLAWVLARAFRDNPLNLAVIGGTPARRVRSNRRGMRLTLTSALGRAMLVGASPATGGIAGGLVALPPKRWPLPPPPLGVQLRTLIGQGWGVSRAWSRVFSELEAVHPARSHWYLAVVGVEPEQQGRGIGAELVGHFVRQVDAEGESAYLETDRGENVAFYERFGFCVEDELKLQGVSVWRMWREASSSH